MLFNYRTDPRHFLRASDWPVQGRSERRARHVGGPPALSCHRPAHRCGDHLADSGSLGLVRRHRLLGQEPSRPPARAADRRDDRHRSWHGDLSCRFRSDDAAADGHPVARLCALALADLVQTSHPRSSRHANSRRHLLGRAQRLYQLHRPCRRPAVANLSVRLPRFSTG